MTTKETIKQHASELEELRLQGKELTPAQERRMEFLKEEIARLEFKQPQDQP